MSLTWCVICDDYVREPHDHAPVTVQEAREAVVMCYHPASFSEAEFSERLDALIAAVREERVEVTEAMVEAGAQALAQTAGIPWELIEASLRGMGMRADARTVLTAVLEAR